MEAIPVLAFRLHPLSFCALAGCSKRSPIPKPDLQRLERIERFERLERVSMAQPGLIVIVSVKRDRDIRTNTITLYEHDCCGASP
jgi:hypothetical protein